MCSTWSKTFLCSWLAREQLHQTHHRQSHMLTASKGSSKSSKYIYRRQPLLIAVLHGCSSGSSSVGNCEELWSAVECCGVPLELWGTSGAVGSCGELWGSSGAVGASGAMGNLWICGCLCGCGGPLRLANFGVPWDCGGSLSCGGPLELWGPVGASGAAETCCMHKHKLSWNPVGKLQVLINPKAIFSYLITRSSLLLSYVEVALHRC